MKTAEPSLTRSAEIAGLAVELNHAPNPDIVGGYWESMPPKGKRLVEVKSIAHASEVCSAFIEEWRLGGGNWTGGVVRLNGRIIARISYNGRSWTREFGEPDNREIL